MVPKTPSSEGLPGPNSTNGRAWPLSSSQRIIDTFTPALGRADVALLLPAHNEAESIERVVFDFYDTIGKEMPVELVCTEDGSTDGTERVLAEISEKIPIKLLLSPGRKGYAGGIKDGLRLVRAEYVLFVDSDGQHRASDFFKLWKRREAHTIVSGCRVSRSDTRFRKVMSRVFQSLVRLLFQIPSFRDVTAPFKLVRTTDAKAIMSECKYMRESLWTEFTLRAYNRGLSILEIPVGHGQRLSGSTKVYGMKKLPTVVTLQLLGLLRLLLETRVQTRKPSMRS